jgi:hypothetical protein
LLYIPPIEKSYSDAWIINSDVHGLKTGNLSKDTSIIKIAAFIIPNEMRKKKKRLIRSKNIFKKNFKNK